jgi:hypothetical protein
MNLIGEINSITSVSKTALNSVQALRQRQQQMQEELEKTKKLIEKHETIITAISERRELLIKLAENYNNYEKLFMELGFTSNINIDNELKVLEKIKSIEPIENIGYSSKSNRVNSEQFVEVIKMILKQRNGKIPLNDLIKLVEEKIPSAKNWDAASKKSNYYRICKNQLGIRYNRGLFWYDIDSKNIPHIRTNYHRELRTKVVGNYISDVLKEYGKKLSADNLYDLIEDKFPSVKNKARDFRNLYIWCRSNEHIAYKDSTFWYSEELVEREKKSSSIGIYVDFLKTFDFSIPKTYHEIYKLLNDNFNDVPKYKNVQSSIYSIMSKIDNVKVKNGTFYKTN